MCLPVHISELCLEERVVIDFFKGFVKKILHFIKLYIGISVLVTIVERITILNYLLFVLFEVG